MRNVVVVIHAAVVNVHTAQRFHGEHVLCTQTGGENQSTLKFRARAFSPYHTQNVRQLPIAKSSQHQPETSIGIRQTARFALPQKIHISLSNHLFVMQKFWSRQGLDECLSTKMFPFSLRLLSQKHTVPRFDR